MEASDRGRTLVRSSRIQRTLNEPPSNVKTAVVRLMQPRVPRSRLFCCRPANPTAAPFAHDQRNFSPNTATVSFAAPLFNPNAVEFLPRLRTALPHLLDFNFSALPVVFVFLGFFGCVRSKNAPLPRTRTGRGRRRRTRCTRRGASPHQ